MMQARSVLLSFLSSASLCLVLSSTARALPVTYTDSAVFLAALSGTPTTAGFDGLSSGQVISSGGTADGITFTYDFGGVDLPTATATGPSCATRAATASRNCCSNSRPRAVRRAAPASSTSHSARVLRPAEQWSLSGRRGPPFCPVGQQCVTSCVFTICTSVCLQTCASDATCPEQIGGVAELSGVSSPDSPDVVQCDALVYPTTTTSTKINSNDALKCLDQVEAVTGPCQ
jgi:hypothetical protein